MLSRKRLAATDRNSTVPAPRVVIRCCSAYDLSWPSIVACAILLGFLFATNFGGTLTFAHVADQFHRLLDRRDRAVEPGTPQALVITANRSTELVVVATLSPRGFHPLLAGSEREVLAQIQAHPGTMKLAVVDATLRDYAGITRALRGSMPVGDIIVLNGSHRPQDIGPTLLNRLRGPGIPAL